MLVELPGRRAVRGGDAVKVTKGLAELRKFVRQTGLSIADLHKGLVKRFGPKRAGSYERVYSWANGERRPDEGARAMLWTACGIHPSAWRSQKETKRDDWLAGKRSK